MGKFFSKSQVQKVAIKVDLVDENQDERGHWSGRFDFLLACLGSAVGLGNVWRFPYLCYKNGGGAFLIPYVLMIFFVGIPIFLIELSLGQYSAFGPLNVFLNLIPFFKGIGYAMILACFAVNIYYNMILGWTTFYFFDAFRGDLQWQYCNHDFNTDSCFNEMDYLKCKANNETNIFNFQKCFNASFANEVNISDLATDNRISPGQEYFNNYMLRRSDGIHNPGAMQWKLVLCLLASWIVVLVSLVKGIKTSGKVVYFTATFPYVILVMLFVQGILLEGSEQGIRFYLVPDFVRLYDIQVWEAAAIQVFYSFGIAGGGMITFASYNRFYNNLLRDALIIGLADMLTSVFSGLVVFSMLGFMAHQMKKPVAEVVESGTGLAFIAYPDGIARTTAPTLWALLFFFMLFLLGVDSQFAGVEVIITFIFDAFPRTRRWKPVVVTTTCVILFICGLPLTTEGGIYVFELMDYYSAGWPYLLIGLMECVVVAYIYGVTNFLSDLKEMCGWCPGVLVRSHVIVVMVTIAPLVITFITLMSWVNFEPLSLGDYIFPKWANDIGWVLAMIPLTLIIFGAVHEVFFCHWEKTFKERVKLWFTPTDIWRENAVKNAAEKLNSTPSNPSGNTMSTLNVNFDQPVFILSNTGTYDNFAVERND